MMKMLVLRSGLALVLLACAAWPVATFAQQPSEVLIEARFRVSVTWQDHRGRTGNGFPVVTQDRSAIFAFFEADNWELLVKVLNGCSLNEHYWVFASASTNVAYTLEVEDLVSGSRATYSNPLGRAAPAITDTEALRVCGSPDEDPFRLRRVRSDNELRAQLQQGLMATYSGSSEFAYGPTGVTGGPSGLPGAPSPDGSVSTTNVQELGVDEADRIKSDGNMLYILKSHQSLREVPSAGLPDQLRILDLDREAPSAVAVAELDLTFEESQRASGMYLHSEANQLVVTATRWLYESPFPIWGFWYSPLAWLDATSSVALVDVVNPAFPVQTTTLELDGEIISSRTIDDVLYLATRYHPNVPGLDFYNPATPDAVEHIKRIENAELVDLLPKYRTTDDPQSRLLVDPGDCYLPTDDAPGSAADVITLVALDLNTLKPLDSTCFVGATETIYVSLGSIYVASTRYGYELMFANDGTLVVDYAQPNVETDLHKFSLEEGQISYRASASVDGHLGWNVARKPFRLSEQGDDLRVITYTDELTPDASPVALSVLRDNGSDELELLSRLPNATHPEPIGKPGEELYATRFVGERAYLVTFLITDPLYVIDLSEPAAPYVAGELEISGYSDYLHPIEGGFVVGVGKEAIPDPGGDFRGAWYQGVKVALYDVRDPARPVEVHAVELGKRGSHADVLGNHRAFTYLPAASGRNPRIAIGAQINERGAGPGDHPSTFYSWSYSGLHLFEVDPTAGALLEQGAMVVERYQESPTSSSSSPIAGDDRAVLADEAVFYVHGDDVYSAFWSDPGSWHGPD